MTNDDLVFERDLERIWLWTAEKIHDQRNFKLIIENAVGNEWFWQIQESGQIVASGFVIHTARYNPFELCKTDMLGVLHGYLNLTGGSDDPQIRS